MADRNDTQRLYSDLSERFGKDIADRLFAYVDRILEKNEHINLTAVRDRDDAMQKHLADSLSIIDIPEFSAAKRIIDVGTGAGFPGALLAIACPDKEFVLLDSTLKRLKVIDGIAEELGISNVRTVHARAEEIAKKDGFGGSFDMCVSRAVAGLDRLAGWCLPFVRKGGYMAAYKGENYETELNEASAALRKAGGRLTRTEQFSGSQEDISGHVILLIRKER